MVEYVIPAIQPNHGTYPDLWKPADGGDRQGYADTLAQRMEQWFEQDDAIGINLEARNRDLAVVRLTLGEVGKVPTYFEEDKKTISEVLTDLYTHIHQSLPGNFQLMPDFRLFVDNSLYLVKPTRKRFWLRTSALADADAIALDLHDAVRLRRSRGGS